MAGWKDNKAARVLIPTAVGTVLVVALILLFNALKEYRYKDIIETLHGYSKEIVIAALALTITNYIVLSLYDLLALKYVEQKFPYPKTLFISFISYVFSYNVGLSVFGSSAIRLRFYSTWGLDGGMIAKIITFCITTFWVGLAAIGGVTLLTGPAVQTSFPAFNASTRVLGFALTAIAVAYLAACFSGKASVSFRRFKIALPSGKLAVGQMIVAGLDWLFSALTLFVLLPAGSIPFTRFLSIFIVAQLAAFSSHVPGGVGILETVLVLSLSSYIPSGKVFSALLVYRAVFYLFPLFVAIIAFATRELWAGWKKAAGIAKAAASIMPDLLASAVFIAGAVLLFSAATPSLAQRLKLFGSLFPLVLLETSHFAASLVGLALLLIADALRRRIDAAYFIAVGLLGAGAVFSLFKAFEWEEALILLLILGLLVPSRKLFYKRAVLFTRPNAWWVLAVGTVLASSAWIGLFAFKHVQFSRDLWWNFDLSRNAPRFFRAGLGVALCSAIIAMRILLGHKPPEKKDSPEEDSKNEE